MTSSTALESLRAFVAGEWISAADGRVFETADPSSGSVWAEVPRCGEVEVARAAEAARRAAREGPWSRMRPTERGRWLRRLGDAIAADVEALARVESRDNGKRLSECRAQVADLPETFHYFAGLADKFEGAVVPVDRADTFAYTAWESCGVIGAITAWNSPLMLAVWKIAPALAAGNAVVLKPSEHASASTLALMRTLSVADLPVGVLNVVTGMGDEAGRALVMQPAVDRISFTGSVSVGRKIAALAGEHLKHTTLELGGKSAQLVFEDADLELAARGVLSGVFVSNGQSCVAGSRLLVHRSVHDALVERLLRGLTGVRFGEAGDISAQVGPIANPPQLARIERMVATARAQGARCVVGGHVVALTGGGRCYAPTVFVDVLPDMEIAREEVFGPVLVVLPFDDEAHAVALAEDSSMGLAAGVWTRDLARAHRLARRLRVGTVYVNAYRGVAPQLPCGGVKSSGWGRENGIEALREFMQLKSVWIGLGEVPDPYPCVPSSVPLDLASGQTVQE